MSLLAITQFNPGLLDMLPATFLCFFFSFSGKIVFGPEQQFVLFDCINGQHIAVPKIFVIWVGKYESTNPLTAKGTLFSHAGLAIEQITFQDEIAKVKCTYNAYFY